MYIHSVKLNNYKSFGHADNKVLVDKGITTIIGKNESGKSNILEGISHLSVTKPINEIFNEDNLNRRIESTKEISFEIILKPKKKLNIKLNNGVDTILFFKKDTQKATGSLVDIFEDTCKVEFNKFYKLFEKNIFELTAQNLKKLNEYRKVFMINKSSTSLDFQKINIAIKFFENSISKRKAKFPEIENQFMVVEKLWSNILKMVPQIFFSNTDKILKPRYNATEVEEQLNGTKPDNNSLLPNLLTLINVSKEEFIQAAKPGMNPRQRTIREKIKDNIDSKINKVFSKFYDTEKITLRVDFIGNHVGFLIKSNDGMVLPLEERSNGLRWYLNTFIDAKSQGIDNSNVLYLFDEPGTSLHVDAQRTLLNLFTNLISKGNQIIYTTHSPYMLNLNSGIQSIRPVIKTLEGDSRVFKTAYDHRVTTKAQQETLTPIIKAIGMSLSDTFGPAKDKLNIVTEGITDYIYIKSIFKYLELSTENFNIIPSFGVTNSINICNILEGWGCPLLVIFDFDYEGVEKGAKKLENSHLYEYKTDFIYINDPSDNEIKEKIYKDNPIEIENMIGEKQFKKIREDILVDDISKTLVAKIFMDELLKDNVELIKETENNFKKLYNEINKIYKIKV